MNIARSTEIDTSITPTHQRLIKTAFAFAFALVAVYKSFSFFSIVKTP